VIGLGVLFLSRSDAVPSPLGGACDFETCMGYCWGDDVAPDYPWSTCFSIYYCRLCVNEQGEYASWMSWCLDDYQLDFTECHRHATAVATVREQFPFGYLLAPRDGCWSLSGT
jgi:hypothetical protein